MSVAEKIEALRVRHKELEARIEEEASRPLPDEIEIQTLKKQKLRIKDEIAQLQA